MLRRLLPFACVTLLSVGCVDVTEPLGDIEKAKPDDKLIGEWIPDDSKTEKWVIDRPEVKGNPKGLMRLQTFTRDGKPGKEPDKPVWFFTTEVGKHTYANGIVTGRGDTKPVDFSKEGEYEKWAKRPNREYIIARLGYDRDAFGLHIGKEKAFAALMKKEKIEALDGYYKTPPGWLANYLEKNGPEAIFDDKPSRFTRAKK